MIVSLAAITILGAIALALALMTNDGGSPGVAEPTPDSGPGADGMRFDDPQGTYHLDIAPTWQASEPPRAPRIESWAVNGTADEVDVETKTVGEVDLDQYLQLVIDEAPDEVDDFKLREFRVVSIDAPNPSDPPTQLGVVAYDGTREGKPVAYLLVSSVDAGRGLSRRSRRRRAPSTTPRAGRALPHDAAADVMPGRVRRVDR